jgi:hypothetical protein
MNDEGRQAVDLLFKSVEDNTTQINQRFYDAGIDPTLHQALIFSAAKYFEALTKLAEKPQTRQPAALPYIEKG